MLEYSKEIKFTESTIDGLFVIDLPVHGDSRGWFKENYQRAKYTSSGSGRLPDIKIVQNNISFNAQKGVTRGLHAEPWDKFISVATGSVFGAWTDLRAGSPTYGKSFTQIIDPSVAIFVPRGCANGFQALEDNTAYTYLVNDHWSPDAGAQYTFLSIFDESLGINWPIPLGSKEATNDEVEVSDKDKAHPILSNVVPMPPKKTLVIGANGQLGRAVRDLVFDDASQKEYGIYHETFIWTDLANETGEDGAKIQAFDFSDESQYAQFNWAGIGRIINAAAYTNVDGAETDEGRPICWKLNATAPALLAKYASEFEIELVHVSSDYVFDGNIPTSALHTEDEAFSPLGVYAQTKAAGDLAVANTPKHFIVRTSWVVGTGHNFIKIMQSLAEKGIKPTVVDDQYGRLTFTKTLARGIFHLVSTGAQYGTYNLQNSGEVTTWDKIAAKTFEHSGKPGSDVVPVSTDEYFASALEAGKKISPRPTTGTLDLSKIQATGFEPTTWESEFEEYWTKYCV
jgi:dTDP-4-dehydrorhamnose 3,5-epimerase